MELNIKLVSYHNNACSNRPDTHPMYYVLLQRSAQMPQTQSALSDSVSAAPGLSPLSPSSSPHISLPSYPHLDTPAMAASVSRSGWVLPFSHCDTACLVTFNRSASVCCVMLVFLRSFLICPPTAFIRHPPCQFPELYRHTISPRQDCHASVCCEAATAVFAPELLSVSTKKSRLSSVYYRFSGRCGRKNVFLYTPHSLVGNVELSTIPCG